MAVPNECAHGVGIGNAGRRFRIASVSYYREERPLLDVVTASFGWACPWGAWLMWVALACYQQGR